MCVVPIFVFAIGHCSLEPRLTNGGDRKISLNVSKSWIICQRVTYVYESIALVIFVLISLVFVKPQIPVDPSCDKSSASLFLIQFPHPAARGPVNLLPENRGALASPRIRLLTLRHRTFYRRYPSQVPKQLR